MLNIGIVGGGFSGICAGCRLQTKLGNLCSFTIFDDNSDFGGVWIKNVYPGCGAEVPNHLYCFSFVENPDWSSAYCYQPEILHYLQRVATKYNLYSHAKFNHDVKQITWMEKIGQWKVEVVDNTTKQNCDYFFDIIINGQGRFASPEIPSQFKTFEGPLIHTAKWNNEILIDDKTRILAVGAGASAAQILPRLADQAKHLIIYQRHAPWVMPRNNFAFPELVKWAFRHVPYIQTIYRKYLRWLFERNINGFRIGTLTNKLAPFISKFHLWKNVKNPKTRQKLIPSYQFGCKRIVNSNEYYPTFNKPNVTLINQPSIDIKQNGIMTSDGHYYEIDVIVLATGFQVQNFFGNISVIGKNQVDLPQLWTNDKPKTYLSIMNSNAPNFFFLLGPNASSGYTSIIIQLETQVEWIISALEILISKGQKIITVKPEAEEQYMNNLKTKMDKTVYSSTMCKSCNSWYLNPKGDVVEIYPDSTFNYEKLTETIVLSDFHFH